MGGNVPELEYWKMIQETKKRRNINWSWSACVYLTKSIYGGDDDASERDMTMREQTTMTATITITTTTCNNDRRR